MRDVIETHVLVNPLILVFVQVLQRVLRDVSHPSSARDVRGEEEQEKVPTHRAGGELRSEIGSWPPHHVIEPRSPVKSERFAFLDLTGITAITLGFLRMDNIELQYTRAKVTKWSGFRTPDVQRNFSKKDPTQEVQNFRSGRDDQHSDARARPVQTLQKVKSDWKSCSMECSETIRLVH